MGNIFLKIASVICVLFFASCEGIFFYPSAHKFEIPAEINLRQRDVYFTSRDGLRLHAWFLPATPPVKGNILFLHGNAENITSHVRSVFWLPNEGYNVLLPDYRGYGESEGSPSFEGAINDSADAVRFFAARPECSGQKIALLGQSLGGAMAINVAADPQLKSLLSAVISDSAFSGFPSIFRDKLDAFWITSVFRYPLSWLITGRFDPLDKISAISPLPLLIIHGEDDQIVPVAHSDLLYAAAGEPKEYWRVPGAGHIGPLMQKSYREKFLDYLQRTGGGKS